MGVSMLTVLSIIFVMLFFSDASLVKGIPFNWNDPEVSGSDIFSETGANVCSRSFIDVQVRDYLSDTKKVLQGTHRLCCHDCTIV